MHPRPERPAKSYWKVGPSECVLFTAGGGFEVRLVEGSQVTRVATCRDAGHAFQTAREWLARRPGAAAQTRCPRCDAERTRPGNLSLGYVYLRCDECRAVWRIAERRQSERINAEGAFARRRSTRAS